MKTEMKIMMAVYIGIPLACGLIYGINRHIDAAESTRVKALGSVHGAAYDTAVAAEEAENGNPARAMEYKHALERMDAAKLAASKAGAKNEEIRTNELMGAAQAVQHVESIRRWKD